MTDIRSGERRKKKKKWENNKKNGKNERVFFLLQQRKINLKLSLCFTSINTNMIATVCPRFNYKFILLWVDVFINFNLICFLNTCTFIYAIILFLIPQLFINMKLVSYFVSLCYYFEFSLIFYLFNNFIWSIILFFVQFDLFILFYFVQFNLLFYLKIILLIILK